MTTITKFVGHEQSTVTSQEQDVLLLSINETRSDMTDLAMSYAFSDINEYKIEQENAGLYVTDNK